MDITPYLRLMIEKSASDLYFTSESPPRVKVDGRMAAIGKDILTKEIIAEAIDKVLSKDQAEFFKSNLEIDFAIALEGEGRFRVNAFHQRGHPAMVLRYIKADPPELDQLKVPPTLKDLVMHKRGLLLMVGGTGSGKSTTLAGMLNYRNANASGHILTIEDPVEFVHPHKKSLVNQREVGPDTLSYANALKSALREAPDVILIGEIRERETMEAAIEIAGTGHLAVSTLHANNAYQALNRIINMFPEQMHKQLFLDLSVYMRAILSQRLIPSLDGKRRAAVEIMLNTPYMSELMSEGKIEEMKEALENSTEKEMQSFDTALLRLYQEGAISMDNALNFADSRANLESRIHFS
ncbi:PilT/PilU family type 4a pilus ATPase [Magnetococcales bacterium HHB-1]